MNSKKQSTDSKVREIKRRTRKKYSSEEKIRIILEGLRGDESIAEICRKAGINSNVYYKWSKDFLEAGKRRLSFKQDLVHIPVKADGYSGSKRTLFSKIIRD